MSKLMTRNRREVLASAAAATLAILNAGTVTAATALPFAPKLGPRSRVLFVNDLSGDVDGLFAAAHAMLSRSIDLRGVIATATGVRGETAQASAELAREMLSLVKRTDVPVHVGATSKLNDVAAPSRAPGVQAIIDEALRTDTNLPLYVAVGGGLTEVASALRQAPAIAQRMTLVWIGGTREAVQKELEYNFNIDRLSAQYVFNDTDLPIWQIPREAYATCAVSVSEIEAFVAPCGAIGHWLYQKLLDTAGKLSSFRINTGETWVFGDSPLVLLTALSDWVPSSLGRQPRYERTGSSSYDEITAARLDDRGQLVSGDGKRQIRLYDKIDSRMMFSDLYSKLRLIAN